VTYVLFTISQLTKRCHTTTRIILYIHLPSWLLYKCTYTSAKTCIHITYTYHVSYCISVHTPLLGPVYIHLPCRLMYKCTYTSAKTCVHTYTYHVLYIAVYTSRDAHVGFPGYYFVSIPQDSINTTSYYGVMVRPCRIKYYYQILLLFV